MQFNNPTKVENVYLKIMFAQIKLCNAQNIQQFLYADQGQSCVNLNPSNVMKKCVYSDYNC